MKKKITHLSKGEFHIPTPEVVFPSTRILMRVGEGEIYSGSFTLHNQGEGTVRGLVYPSSPRITLQETGFDGNPVKINFKYDGTGLVPGHVEQGKFTIVSNGGEFDLRFTAIIEKPFVMTAQGKIDSIENFKKLAFKDPAEAERLFRSREFYTILKYEEPRILALYDNMRKWELDIQAVEEFLVGCKQKEKIFLTMEEESRAFMSVTETRKETLLIKKNTWGTISLEIDVKGDFISTEHKNLTTGDFVGNSYHLEYYINALKLHPGSNYGMITIRTPYEELYFEIVVEKEVEREEEHRSTDREFAALLRDYFNYEAGLMTLEDFITAGVSKVERLRDLDSRNELYLLIHANILIVGKKFDQARLLLESYNYNRFAIGKNVELSAYYLYLTTQLSSDTLAQRKVAEELSKYYLKNPHSWMILVMLVQVDSQYKIYSERLRMLETLFTQNRTRSTLFYFEAFKCYKDRTSSLKKLGVFEVRVLLFACKYKLMTKELALYASNLASQLKVFDTHLFDALVQCYEMYPETMILSSIVALLVKGECVDSKYFPWYEKAVAEELKIAQLYEYYMAAVPQTGYRKALPRSVYLYFMHGNNLSHGKCSILYANLITNVEESSEIYGHYRDEMEAFAWNQLERRNIDSNLKVIYRRFISEATMTQERMKALYDICHAYQVTTKIKDMRHVYVIAEDGKIEQRAHVYGQSATVFIFSKTDRLVWEHKNGRHYSESIPYESQRLFYELRFMDMTRRYFNSIRSTSDLKKKEELTLEIVRKRGAEHYSDQELFSLCTKTIRDTNYELDHYLTFLCIRLFEQGMYDKVTLTYLSTHYSGSTIRMKQLWHEAKEYEVHTHKLAERILSQMLFSDQLFTENQIFEDYYSEGPYFRLQQAYLAYIGRAYVVDHRKINKSIIDIICKEHEKGEETLDICKIAVLKYYSERDYNGRTRRILRKFLQELSGRQIYFPFFLKYERDWLIELQLIDKTLIEYQGQKGSRVILYYQIQCDDTVDVNYSTEVLTPMLENIYVKKFVLFGNEKLRYHFKETIDGNVYRSDKKVISRDSKIQDAGRYAELNQLIVLKGEEQERAMRNYAVEDMSALQIFEMY